MQGSKLAVVRQSDYKNPPVRWSTGNIAAVIKQYRMCLPHKYIDFSARLSSKYFILKNLTPKVQCCVVKHGKWSSFASRQLNVVLTSFAALLLGTVVKHCKDSGADERISKALNQSSRLLVCADYIKHRL